MPQLPWALARFCPLEAPPGPSMRLPSSSVDLSHNADLALAPAAQEKVTKKKP